MNHVN